jgi:hypothetical protein
MPMNWGALAILVSIALALFCMIGNIALGVRLLLATVGLKHPQVLLYLLAAIARDWAWFRHPQEIAPMAWSEAATAIAAAAVLYRLCRESLADYPAIRRFASQSLVVTLCGCIMLGMAIWWLNPAASSERSPLLQQFNAGIQAVDGGLFAFLVLFGAFLIWFPVQIRRNTIYIIAGFTVYFLSHCVALFLTNIMPAASAGTNLFEFTIAAVLLICGLFLFNKEGETVPVTTGHNWNAAEMGKLTRQLEAINARLSDTRAANQNY